MTHEFCDGKEDLARQTYACFEPLGWRPQVHWLLGYWRGSTGFAERLGQRNVHWPLRADVPIPSIRHRIPYFRLCLATQPKSGCDRGCWLPSSQDADTTKASNTPEPLGLFQIAVTAAS